MSRLPSRRPVNTRVASFSNRLDGEIFFSQSPYNLSNVAEFYDDFPFRSNTPTAPHGMLQWDLTGTISTIGATSLVGRPGILLFGTTSVASLFLRAFATNQFPAMYILSIQQQGSVSANWKARVGIAGIGGSDPAEGIYFKNDGANWLTITKKSPTPEQHDTGIPQSNNWMQLKIVALSLSRIEFFINDTLVSIHTTSVPESFVEMSVVIMSGDGAIRTIGIDYFQARMLGLSR